MTIEEEIQNKLESIESIRNYIAKTDIYAFISPTNPPKCFIRWNIVGETSTAKTLNISQSLQTLTLNISVFSNTLLAGRFITNEIRKAFSITNKQNLIRSAYITAISPIVEDKQTFHFPLTLTIFYNSK